MFEDRYHAGKILTKVLNDYLYQNKLGVSDIVVGILPRGGLPVAFDFLKSTKADFLIVPVKKIPSPYNDEVAIGAIAPDGSYLRDEEFVGYMNISSTIFNVLKEKAWKEVKIRLKKYGIDVDKIKLKVKNKIVILIDDGVATGYTAAVAGAFLKNLGAKKVILAVPICPSKFASILKKSIDEIICLLPIHDFQAVGQGYVNFTQVDDDEFFSILSELNK